MAFSIVKKYCVGIDLSPAGMGATAPGTARYVGDQVRALFKLDVPWTWVPVIDSIHNPLYNEMSDRNLIVVSRSQASIRASFDVGRAWSRASCNAGFATAFFVPFVGCKVVTNFFDTNIYEFGWTWVKSGWRKSYYINRTLSDYSLWRSRRLFILSHYCADSLKSLYPSCADKIRITYPGVNITRNLPHANPPESLSDVCGPFCLNVATFSENKNQRRLIEAWAEWQRTDSDAPSLVLVGSCPTNFLHSVILPTRAKCPRPEQIFIAGHLTDDEVTWCYQNTTLYLQPSFSEGFGLPVIEAMGNDVPVAISRSTSLPEVGGDAAVYFEPGDVQSILHVVRSLWSDTTLQKKLVESGRSRPKLFTWENNVRIVATEIESVLAGK